jgi:hypothetical protein
VVRATRGWHLDPTHRARFPKVAKVVTLEHRRRIAGFVLLP